MLRPNTGVGNPCTSVSWDKECGCPYVSKHGLAGKGGLRATTEQPFRAGWGEPVALTTHKSLTVSLSLLQLQ